MQRTIMVSSVILLVTLTSIQGFYEYRINRQKLEDEIRDLDATVKPLIANAIWLVDNQLLKALGDQMLSREEVVSVSIWDSQGKQLYTNQSASYTSDASIIDDLIPSPAETSYNNSAIGKLQIGYTTSFLVNDIIKSLINILLFNVMKIAVLTGIISWLLNKRVVTPLNQLATTITSLPETPSENGTRVHVDVSHDGEPNEIDMVAQFIEQREEHLQTLITDLRAREETLRDSEIHQRDLIERLEFILRANMLGSWDISLLAESASYNDRWYEMIGLRMTQPANSADAWFSRVHPDDLKPLKNSIDEHISGKTTSIKFIHRIRHENGHYIWVMCTGTAVSRNTQNQATRILGTNLDITDLVTAREDALMANRSKSEFLANMSHEIRTPLNGVLGMTSLLKRTTLDPMQSEFIKTIEISGRQLLSVISDILDLSKVEAGKFELSPAKTSISTVIENVIRILQPAADAKGLGLKFEIGSTVPSAVYCDDTRLQQVLVNLANNAIKFTAHGQIYIHVAGRPSTNFPDRVELEFHVVDEGIGIPPENLKNLFRAFSQADASVTRKYGGTGLGLAISKQIIELMSGKISVTSEVNRGSDFFFTIQIPTVTAMEQAAVIADMAQTSRHINVLIAEDNLVNQKVLFKMLRNHGITPAVATNGVEATHLATTNHYDLILMDLIMPEMDGIEASKRIISHAQSTGAKMPIIIAITATVNDELKVRLKNIGIDTAFEKPLSMTQINQSLRLVADTDAKKEKPPEQAAS